MGTKKVELFMDVQPGQREFYASSATCVWKPAGYKRYKIVIEIPDPNESDAILEVKGLEMVSS